MARRVAPKQPEDDIRNRLSRDPGAPPIVDDALSALNGDAVHAPYWSRTMPQFDIPEFRSPIDGAPFDIRAPRTTLVVIIAGVAILALAAVGFYRGLTGAKSSVANGSAGSTSAIVGAKPAVPAAQNPNWSILSGPQVLPAPTVKPQTDDDDQDDSDTPDDQPAAADQAPAPAAPTPPPAAAAKATAPTSAQPAAPEPPPF